MIRLYDKEVVKIELENCNQKELLNRCSLSGKGKWLKFVVYKDGRVYGGLSYNDVLEGREIRQNYLEISDGCNIFEKAREFLKKEENRHSYIPVIDENGEFVFFLAYTNNRLWQSKRVGDEYMNFSYWDINLLADKDSLDYSLLQEYDSVIFGELEEYTVEICNLLLAHFPEKKICFLDERAKWFWGDEDQIVINSCLREVMESGILTGKRVVIHPSKLHDQHHAPGWIGTEYSSVSVVQSLVWCKNRDEFGELNKGKIIFLMDFVIPNESIVGVMAAIWVWCRIAKKRGWIPVVDLEHLPSFIWDVEGENMWEYLFEPVSDVTVDEAKNSFHVISAYNNDIGAIDIVGNPYYQEGMHFFLTEAREKAKNLRKSFYDFVRPKQELLNYMEKSLPAVFQENGRVLGVIMRGTDYRERLSVKRCRADLNGSLDEAEKRERERAKLYIDYCSELMLEKNCTHIFLGTEDQEYFLLMKERFGDKVSAIDQMRVDISKNDEQVYTEDMVEWEQGEKILFTKTYLATIYALSKCHILLSNMQCGAYNLVKLWGENIEYDEIYEVRI